MAEESRSHEIREFVRKNKIPKAIALLKETRLKDEGFMLDSQLAELKDKKVKGTITSEKLSTEESVLKEKILLLATRLEQPEDLIQKIKNRKFLWIGIGSAVLALLAFYLLTRGNADFVHDKPHGVSVADFKSAENGFRTTTLSQLRKNLKNLDISTAPYEFIDPDKVNEEDIAKITQKISLKKGLLAYGKVVVSEGQNSFNCYIKLIDLKDPPIGNHPAFSGKEFIFNNLSQRLPEQKEITFNVAEKALHIGDFMSCLIKYYVNDGGAKVCFQQVIARAQEVGGMDEILREAKIYLAKAHLVHGEFEEALDILESMGADPSMEQEFTWAKYLGNIALDNDVEAMRDLADFYKNKNLTDSDKNFLKDIGKYMNAKYGSEAPEVLAALLNISAAKAILEGEFSLDDPDDTSIAELPQKPVIKPDDPVDKPSLDKDTSDTPAPVTPPKPVNRYEEIVKKKENVGKTFRLRNTAWKENQHLLKGYSRKEIELLASALKNYPERKIQVQVHTQDGGNKRENKQLSDLRAQVVQEWLTTLGVDKKRIKTKAFGDEEPAKAAKNLVEIYLRP